MIQSVYRPLLQDGGRREGHNADRDYSIRYGKNSLATIEDDSIDGESEEGSMGGESEDDSDDNEPIETMMINQGLVERKSL